MRKHIDRAAVRKVICEKRFLRRLTDKRPDGSVIPGEAFGPACCRLDMWHWAAESLWGGDYVYCITVTDEGLQLAVDSYATAPSQGGKGNKGNKGSRPGYCMPVHGGARITSNRTLNPWPGNCCRHSRPWPALCPTLCQAACASLPTAGAMRCRHPTWSTAAGGTRLRAWACAATGCAAQASKAPGSADGRWPGAPWPR